MTNTTWTRDAINALLTSNPRAVERAMVVLYDLLRRVRLQLLPDAVCPEAAENVAENAVAAGSVYANLAYVVD